MREELDNLINEYIKDDKKRELWELAFDYKDKINLKAIADYYINTRDDYYICELINIAIKFLDLDNIFDKIIATEDKEFMFWIMSNGTIRSLVPEKYFFKLKKVCDKMSYVKFLRQYVGHEPILTAGTSLFVFNERNEVLMQLRTDYNAWGFPGGAMELGESFEETAKRELKEETNLEVDELELIEVLSGKDTFRVYPNGDQLYDITAVFKVKKYHGELKVNDDESKKIRWFPIDNLPENLSPMTKKHLEKSKYLLEKVAKND